MIHRMIFHNDRIVPVEEARFSPGQAGLTNGWGLFTTMRVFQGEPFAYERHWRRLEKDAGRVRIPFPFDAGQVRKQLGESAGCEPSGRRHSANLHDLQPRWLLAQ